MTLRGRLIVYFCIAFPLSAITDSLAVQMKDPACAWLFMFAFTVFAVALWFGLKHASEAE